MVSYRDLSVLGVVSFFVDVKDRKQSFFSFEVVLTTLFTKLLVEGFPLKGMV